MPPRRLAIIDCEDLPHWEGYSQERWPQLLGRDGDTWRSYRATRGELPASPDAHDGYIVTGSHYNVDDDASFVEPLAAFVRACAAAPAPGPRVLGVCFGAQIIAYALGGRVGRNPGGRFVLGLEHIDVAPNGVLKPFLRPTDAELPRVLRLIESHGDCVHELPPGAVPVASSASTTHEMFVAADRMLAFQGHPEFTVDVVLERIVEPRARDGRLDADGAAAIRSSLATPPTAQAVLDLARAFLDGGVTR